MPTLLFPYTDVYFKSSVPTKHSLTWNYVRYNNLSGPGSSVGIVTDYGLDGPGIEPGGARFSAPVQTGPEAHPASCTMDTGSFPGVKCCRGVTLTPHPLLVQKSKIE